MTPKSEPNSAHCIQARVYYEDTDAGGIVYYANYLKFAERARTEFLRDLGFDHHQVRQDHNLMLVVRHAEIDYRASGILDDLLEIATEVIEIRNSSMTMKHVVSRISPPKTTHDKDGIDGPAASLPQAKVLVEIKVVVVAVSKIGRAVRIPPQLRQIFGG